MAPYPVAGTDPFAGTAYRVVEQLGSGGMGAVFLVEHLELGKRFVAKLLHERLAGDAQQLDRLRLEAHSLGRLQHPNIVSAIAFEQTLEGRPFIVMEHLEGTTIGAEMRRRRIEVGEAVALTRQLLSALKALHALGLVHRDLKPENLFLDQRGVLKVLDFGVVRVLPGVSEQAPMPLSLPTEQGMVIGTPRYVSPEAALGAELDQRADLYAAGLILYALLAGRGPFDHVRDQLDLLKAHASEIPKPPSAFGGPVPAELDQIVLKALDKDPERRFQSADEFDAALAAPPAPPAASKLPLGAAAGILALVFLGTIAGMAIVRFLHGVGAG